MKYEYYSILEIEVTASQEEIKKAYRKKAMELHPDRNGGDKQKEAEFKKLNEAYGVLSHPEKKAHYDRFGTAEPMGGGFSGGFDTSDLGDIFSSFFSGGFGASTSQRRRADIGQDIEIRLKISLEDALCGVSRSIEYSVSCMCPDCAGVGGEATTCSQCAGSGQVRERVETIFGTMEQARSCSSCGGTGKKITKQCSSCNGQGKITKKKEKTIEVPKGIEDGMSIKLHGEGNEGKDGNGDLYITFSVPDCEGGLKRQGSNLHYTIEISPVEAVLGTKKTLQIPIIGKKDISIHAGTQHGEEIRFTHEGVPLLDGRKKKGDLILHMHVVIPKRISNDQKKLYEALLQSEEGTQKRGWLEEFLKK